MKMIETVKKHKKTILFYGTPMLIFLFMIALAVVFQQGVPYNNIALDLGFAQIAWYATFILTGISLGAYFAYHEFKKVGWHTDILFDALLYAVPLSIVGSRLYYVLFDPVDRYDSFFDVINITQGGLSIHGAFLTAFVFIVFFTKKKKISFWVLADIIAIGFFIGQIVGRWGNFMNQEAYGPIIQSEFVLKLLPGFIQNQMFIDGNYHHPTFLYEGIWNFIGLVFLLIARRKRWFKAGDMIGFYLIWYGLGRGAIIEPLRVGGHPTDALRMFGLPANIILSLGLFMLGGVAIIVAKRILLPNQPYYVDILVTEDDQNHSV